MQVKLKKHINSEQIKNMFKCEVCDETFDSIGNFIDVKGTGCYKGKRNN